VVLFAGVKLWILPSLVALLSIAASSPSSADCPNATAPRVVTPNFPAGAPRVSNPKWIEPDAGRDVQWGFLRADQVLGEVQYRTAKTAGGEYASNFELGFDGAPGHPLYLIRIASTHEVVARIDEVPLPYGRKITFKYLNQNGVGGSENSFNAAYWEWSARLFFEYLGVEGTELPPSQGQSIQLSQPIGITRQQPSYPLSSHQFHLWSLVPQRHNLLSPHPQNILLLPPAPRGSQGTALPRPLLRDCVGSDCSTASSAFFPGLSAMNFDPLAHYASDGVLIHPTEFGLLVLELLERRQFLRVGDILFGDFFRAEFGRKTKSLYLSESKSVAPGLRVDLRVKNEAEAQEIMSSVMNAYDLMNATSPKFVYDSVTRTYESASYLQARIRPAQSDAAVSSKLPADEGSLLLTLTSDTAEGSRYDQMKLAEVLIKLFRLDPHPEFLPGYPAPGLADLVGSYKDTISQYVLRPAQKEGDGGLYSLSGGSALVSKAWLAIFKSHGLNPRRATSYTEAHEYLVDDQFGAGNEVIICGSYLQFLEKMSPERKRRLPKVFVGSRAELRAFFSQHKEFIDPHSGIWQDGTNDVVDGLFIHAYGLGPGVPDSPRSR
jgi:hypothetical protein